MAAKNWIPEALRGLAESLAPVPHEINEIDWKAPLPDNSARLAELLMAFANHSPNPTTTPLIWRRTPPKLPPIRWGLPSFEGELPSFNPGTRVIG
jgi:hypothetical protein